MKNVKSYLERDVRVFCQEHFELAHTDSEVTVRELVRNVETQGTELPALNSHAVEQRKWEK